MNYVYHGSKIQGLKVIEPHMSSHQKEWVYASKNKCVATIFLRSGGGDLAYYLEGIGTTDNPIVLVERLPDMFDKYFNGSGSIYTLDSSSFKESSTQWSVEVVSCEKQPVLEEEIVDNVFEKLLEYEKEGLIKIFRYPNRPPYIPLDNSDLIDIYINHYNRGSKYAIDSLLKIYPQFSESIYSKLNNKQK